jgi:5-methyltetrahydrofolate--homocysteine methyltransferase
MILKEDIKEAKERMNAWWDHEIIDRPTISYYIPKKRGMGGYLDALGQGWKLAQNPDDIEPVLDRFEKTALTTYYGGEAIPSFWPNYGPGIVAAVFGVEPLFKSQTVWFSCPTKPEDIVPLLESVKLNQNNEWYSRLKRITEISAERAGKNYQAGITDIGGVLDILSSFLGPTNMILTMKRKPEIIHTCREIILEKLLKIYDEHYKIIKSKCNGFNAWLNVWCAKSWYPIQCDFSAMLNPKWFKEFALPDIKAQVEHMDYALYHLDGPDAIIHLDDLLEIDGLTGIQWVPGAGRHSQGHESWFFLYKKIQAAGKNIVIDTPPENVPRLYKKLDTKGLFVRTNYSSEIIAKFHLPTSIGGEDGVLIDKGIEWIKKNNYERMTPELIDIFLSSQKLEYDSKIKRTILKQINSCMMEKLFFT